MHDALTCTRSLLIQNMLNMLENQRIRLMSFLPKKQRRVEQRVLLLCRKDINNLNSTMIRHSTAFFVLLKTRTTLSTFRRTEGFYRVPKWLHFLDHSRLLCIWETVSVSKTKCSADNNKSLRKKQSEINSHTNSRNLHKLLDTPVLKGLPFFSGKFLKYVIRPHATFSHVVRLDWEGMR